jgi:transposase-like protein
MPKRSELKVEQRQEAVLALLRREEPAVQLARRYGISEQTLYRWRDEFLAAGKAALAKGKNGTEGREREIRELKAQLEERGLVIGELTVANRILKKVSGQLS